MNDIVVISVVRDFDLYNRLVASNVFFRNAQFVTFDNRKDNKFISVRYNQFLDNYDYSQAAWFVFCHEDWELLEDLSARLEVADKGCLYGVIGTVFVPKKNKYLLRSLGYVKNSDKKGENVRFYGRSCPVFTQVDTFDCQCLVVHSSLIAAHTLRFDENLHFDLYVEDFCINAREKYGILSKILNIKCQHYSFGSIEQRFYDNFAYLQEKYKNACRSYSNCLVTQEIGKKLDKRIKREPHGLVNSLKRRLYKLFH